MVETKAIYCPRCGRKVAKRDKESKINISVNCRKCQKRIVYFVDTDKTEIKNIPPRNCSSGMRFY